MIAKRGTTFSRSPRRCFPCPVVLVRSIIIPDSVALPPLAVSIRDVGCSSPPRALDERVSPCTGADVASHRRRARHVLSVSHCYAFGGVSRLCVSTSYPSFHGGAGAAAFGGCGSRRISINRRISISPISRQLLYGTGGTTAIAASFAAATSFVQVINPCATHRLAARLFWCRSTAFSDAERMRACAGHRLLESLRGNL
jgi:hypothetical protein